MMRTQIQLLPEQHAELSRVARAKRISLSELLRRVVDKALSEDLKLDRPRGAAALLASCGQFSEARKSSTAASHDAHLADIYR
jgi:hypothetical protein